MSDDTDTLLAMLMSLLEPPLPSNSVLLEVLVDCNGDTEAAAIALKVPKLRNQLHVKNSKRKRPVSDLDGWLKEHGKRSAVAKVEQPEVSESFKFDGLIKFEDNNDESNLLDAKAANIQARSSILQSPKPIKASRLIQPLSASRDSKPVTDLMSVLHAPTEETKSIPRLSPLTLANPEMVAQHTPCTLHLNVLPPELACHLFYAMMEESEDWARNKWWMFDKLVESPHRTSFYIRRDKSDNGRSWHDAAKYWYNGRRSTPPKLFPSRLEEACRYVERIVNDEIKKRSRFPLEYAGVNDEGYNWTPNVAASNRYEGRDEGVGFHSDQLTYLGPYCTIASISLGTSRVFRLREVIPFSEREKRQARTFNIPLPHNSLIIMHASTQERFKHSIPQQNAIDTFRPSFPRNPGEAIETYKSRINITFRFYRPDYCAELTPKCKCGIPMILRPDMKNRNDGQEDKYWWTCYAAAQKDGQTCNLWQVMDVKKEERGPFIKDVLNYQCAKEGAE